MTRLSKLELHRSVTEILRTEDLNFLTTKKIRMICEKKFNVNLSLRRREIDRSVMAFVHRHSENVKKGKMETFNDISDPSELSSSSSSCESSYSPEAESKQVAMKKTATADFPKEITSQTAVSMKKKIRCVPAKNVQSLPAISMKETIEDASAKEARSNPAENDYACKKMKKEDSLKESVVDDAAYARQLRAEEWNFRATTLKKLTWFDD